MIVLVCGLPASGKTTIAVRARRRLADRGRDFELLHSDDFSRRPYDRLYERVADATADDAGSGRGGRGSDWILDGTFFRREWRNRFYRLDDVYEVWIEASLATCLERNRGRTDAVPEAGLRSIARKFEAPRADLVIDTETQSVAEAVDRFEAAVLEWEQE